MSNTLIYTAKLQDGKVVLMYQNRASSSEKNAMILPIPSKKQIEKSDFDVCEAKNKDFLKEFLNMLTPRTLGDAAVAAAGFNAIETYKVGSYDITACKSPNFLRYALRKLGLSISDKFVDEYKNRYPNWPLLICQWSGTIDAEPIIVTYEPINDKKLFVPMLDSHDGVNFKSKAMRDHKIGAAFFTETGGPVNASVFPHLDGQVFANKMLKGTRVIDYYGMYENKDIYFEVKNPQYRYHMPVETYDYLCNCSYYTRIGYIEF